MPSTDAALRDAEAPDLSVCADDDGDGVEAAGCGGADCDDTDAARYPGATEVCDGDDEDCDDTTFGPDLDGDGETGTVCCNGMGCGADCDDARADVRPGATEACNGGIDDDCNGLADAADGVCVPCRDGFVGFDGDCVDVDECASLAPCGVGEAVAGGCTNTEGSYACACRDGFSAPATGGTCADVDECTPPAEPCGVVGACMNTTGSYSCACDPGYVSDGGRCVDVNECATLAPCGVGALAMGGCANSPGTYVCACASGYAAPSSGGTCANIDECAAMVNPCGVGSCTDNAGSYACTCDTGYRDEAGGAITCVDIDECALGIDLCSDAPAATCVNMPGDYTCTCPSGFGGTGRGSAGCRDIDECTANTDGCDSSPEACSNTTGSFACRCPMGFVGTGVGPAGCACPAGYEQVGSECLDINECLRNTDNCDDDPSACVNNTGSFTCVCPATFVGMGVGASGCTCPSGYERVGTRCEDIDECDRNTDGCDDSPEACANTTGSFNCACPAGYVGAALGTSGCQWDDPSLAALGLPAGAVLLPAFSPAVTAYRLMLPPGLSASTVQPTVAVPARTTLTAASTTFASGGNVPVASGSNFAPGAVSIVVTTETGATRTYTFVVVRGNAYLKADNAGDSDAFGTAMAISADGNTLAVGANLEDTNGSGTMVTKATREGDDTLDASGAVYVFRRIAGVWTQEAYLKASNAGATDQFGVSVALSADGSVLAVGAPQEDSGATGVGGDQTNGDSSNSGAAYVFRRGALAWTQEAYVKASNTGRGDEFGTALALSADGTRLAVSAPYERSSALGVGGMKPTSAARTPGRATSSVAMPEDGCRRRTSRGHAGGGASGWGHPSRSPEMARRSRSARRATATA